MSDPYQRDFAAPLQAAHRSAGAASTKRTLQPAAGVDWDAAIGRLRRTLRGMYAKGAMEGPELPHQRSESQDGAS